MSSDETLLTTCADQSPATGTFGTVVYCCALRPGHRGSHWCRDDLGSFSWGVPGNEEDTDE